MNLNDPVIRFLAFILAVPVAIRAAVELLAPVAPYLLAGLMAFVVARLVAWHRGRW